MPSVFLSYARDDLEVVQQLEQRLIKNDVSVWRDQEKIRGGHKWPKVLGEAIAANDFFLLAWSKNARDSHFVEFEWCTAVALKKTIIPCLLDSIPLPDSLKAVHGIDAREPAQAIPDIVDALQTEPPGIDPAHRTAVIQKLGAIGSTEPQEVVRVARAIFQQHHWTIHGDVHQYQAARDVNITNVAIDKPVKTWLDKWQTWVALLVGILTATTLLFQIHEKMGSSIGQIFTTSTESNRLLEQPIEGLVIDESGNPLSGVHVSVRGYTRAEDTTDEKGEFRIRVNAQNEQKVHFMAQKDGFETYSSSANLGNTRVIFTMRRIRR